MPDIFTITVNRAVVPVTAGITVAAAIARTSSAAGAGASAGELPVAPVGVTRRSVNGALRAPLCGMGVCQECRVTVDGRAHVLACQTLCRPGMSVLTAEAVA